MNSSFWVLTRQCWESYVGQYVYKLFIITMIIESIQAVTIQPIEYFLNQKKIKVKVLLINFSLEGS
jgi:hypothetical protein